MNGITVNKAIEVFNKLSLEDEEFVVNIAEKQLIEKKENLFAKG